jgi:hypothetical protein
MKDIKVIFLIGLALFVAVIGILSFLRKRLPNSITPQEQNTLLGPFSFVITLYAFLLGFIVVNLWQTFDQADRTAAKEAETVGIIYLLSEIIPESERIRHTLGQYVTSVIHDEWPAMNTGQSSPKTEEIHFRIWRDIRDLAPTTEKEVAAYTKIVDQFSELTRYRRDRVFLIQGSLPSVMWWSIIVGSGLLLTGMYYLGIGNVRHQAVIDALVIGMLFITLYLAVEFNGPFQGDLKISPRAFEFIEAKIQRAHQ